MSYPQLSILIPAAGASKRLGRVKQLVRYKSRTLIENAVNIALSIDPRELIVVTGANSGAVEGAIQSDKVSWVHNSNWPSGMGSSIATGAAVVNRGATGVMILLCDQWRLQTADLQQLAEAWRSNPKCIVCARVEHQNMPPAIFPISLLDRLQSLDGDTGAWQILKDHPELLSPVALNNALFDLDTPSQLVQLKTFDL
jgi:molybdenum cofactor cytidylyltransferase